MALSSSAPNVPTLRSKDAPARVLDEATRNRRRRKALEALEQDNFHEDPHANLVMHKKAPKFDGNLPDDSSSGLPLAPGATPGGGGRSRRSGGAAGAASKARSLEYYKQRYRKNFGALLEEDVNLYRKDEPNYVTAKAGPSRYPPRHFCAVCGDFGGYTCVTCGMRYCSVKCLQTHKETRCLKFIA
jgi:zinc finger HIT domain-containing protein 1